MSETPKLTPEERAEAAILYERLSGDGDALERFIYFAVSIRAKLERELAAERERTERAEAELAKLRQHAEAMHEQLEELIGLAVFAMRAANRDGAEFDVAADLYEARESIRNYRADFPEEK